VFIVRHAAVNVAYEAAILGGDEQACLTPNPVVTIAVNCLRSFHLAGHCLRRGWPTNVLWPQPSPTHRPIVLSAVDGMPIAAKRRI